VVLRQTYDDDFIRTEMARETNIQKSFILKLQFSAANGIHIEQLALNSSKSDTI
jgi:hypothetical protein